MKKLLTAAIVTVCLALTACGSSSAEDTSAASTAVSSGSDETKETSGGPKGRIAYIVGALGDKSFADSGEAGMDILSGNWGCFRC